MDSGTHLVIGLGLAGLASIDPIVTADSTTAAAVMIGTVIGSQAPDADGLLRFWGNAIYIKNHRGKSHSIPAILLWTLGITAALSLLFGPLPLLHVALWTLLAVSFHVFTDLFNTYGTQAMWPKNKRWIAWNIIPIFDPFLFIIHVVAILLWVTHAIVPQILFPTLYGIVIVYYVWRTIEHHLLERGLVKQDLFHEEGDRYWLIPTINMTTWHVIKRQSSGDYVLGELQNRQLLWINRLTCDSHPAVEKSKTDRSIASFLSYSSFACAEVREHTFGYEVRWIDVRYRHRKQYPFVAVLLTDFRHQPIDSYVGWLSESRLEKKLGLEPSSS